MLENDSIYDYMILWCYISNTQSTASLKVCYEKHEPKNDWNTKWNVVKDVCDVTVLVRPR